MKTYLNLLKKVLNKGSLRDNRTDIPTLSTFGHQMRFNLSKGFPLLTTKEVHFPSIAHELIWFLRGDTNIKYLQENNVKIWNEWADEKGNLGPVYGHQWRNWNSENIDQISLVLKNIKEDPTSRRHVISAWNPSQIDKMSLPPCHTLFQFYVETKNKVSKLSCQLYQRSCDVFLGLPFNIASYSLLIHIFAKQLNMEVGEFIWTGGDIHIYTNHVQQCLEQLTRQPRKLPKLIINGDCRVDKLSYKQFVIEGYNPHPRISAPIAV